jgi:outer membrane receptor protein involved in Fe transport
MTRRAGLRVLLALLAMTGTAYAQGADIVDVEVPAVVVDTSGAGPDDLPDEGSEIDLANIVQSAAKGVTTVQEAPAIVTVITADEIRDRQFQFLDQIYDTVPGWYRIAVLHGNAPSPLVRGQIQAVQYLHDSVSLFDPAVNVPSVSRVQPIETIKRIEMITGPGGVLWGSNSLLGILNVITKDADDVDGVEMGGTLGHGNGDREMARAYAMIGEPDLLDGKLKLFAHGSFETYAGAGMELPLLLFHQPLPQPNAPNIYGPLTTSTPPRSLLFNLSAKLTAGNFKLRISAPFIEKHNSFGLSGTPVQEDLIQDDLVDMSGQPLCGNEEPLASPDTCVDRGRLGRDMEMNFFDRYVVGEFSDRFAEERAGISIKAYGMQFVRDFKHLAVLAPSPAIQGGLAFGVDITSYRAGGAIDGDIEPSRKLRVLYGAEAFHEWQPVTTERSLQGAGLEATAFGPYLLERLPLLCPREVRDDDGDGMGEVEVMRGCPLTFAFPASRSVFGAYLNPQYRPSKKLILDAGARVQIAPSSLGKLSYDLQPTIAGTAVYQFIPNWHVKLNYAQGFRPPVFNNTNGNGEAIQIAGNPNLGVETSDAAQVEVNARILKNKRRIRELNFRADYSHTRIQNLIQVQAGQYANTADRALDSAEFLGKLYIQGGHRIELGYTWLRVDTADKGVVRALPEHWFNLAGVWTLIDDKLTATTNVKVAGAAEDPNRLVEYRNLAYDEMGNIVNVDTGLNQAVTTNAAEVVMDRLPPIAELSLGMMWLPMDKLAVRATVFNTLNGRFYQPDAFFDYEPHLEFLPNPYEDLRAYVSATYQY